MQQEHLANGTPVFITQSHRFGQDALLLAHFCRVQLRYGAGRDIQRKAWAAVPSVVPAQGNDPAAGAQIAHSLGAAHAAVQAAEAWHITPVTADLRDLAGLHPYAQSRDVVACNPPYFTGGRVSPDTARAGARHELSCTMPDVCAAAGLLLKDGGRLCVCQRPERLADVLCAMRGARIEPKRLQFVMARPEKAPWLVLVEGQKNRAPGLRVPAPLVTARADGRPSAAMLEIYGTEPKKEAP